MANTDSIPQVLSQLIRPEYQLKMSTWHEAATKEELEGLELIKQIVDSKGTCVSSLPFLVGRLEPNHKFMSTYTRFFGGTHLPGMSEIAVLEFKKVSELQCSIAVNKVPLLYLDTWASKETNERKKILVIKALRSLAAKIFAREIPISTNAYTSYTADRIGPMNYLNS